MSATDDDDTLPSYPFLSCCSLLWSSPSLEHKGKQVIQVPERSIHIMGIVWHKCYDDMVFDVAQFKLTAVVHKALTAFKLYCLHRQYEFKLI